MAVLGTDTYTRDNLIIGEYETDNAYPVASGNSVKRGQVMKVSSGKLSPCLTTEAPFTIMVEDVDASAADTVGNYMTRGEVLESEVNYNTGSAAEFRDALRAYNILTRR